MLRPAQVRPTQVGAAAVTSSGFEDITAMITAIMPLIMLVLMFQMLKPLLGGLAGEAKG